MFEKLKEYWNKYKKYIIAILILIMGVFLLNFLFVITDWIAGKGFNGCAMIYSPVSNEEWLSFIGNGIVGLATLLLFWIAKKSLEHERKKVRYEDESKKLKKEKEIVEEYLSTFDIDSLYNLGILGASSSKEFYNTKEIENYIYNEKEKKEKELNSLIIKINFNTNFKILLKKEFLRRLGQSFVFSLVQLDYTRLVRACVFCRVVPCRYFGAAFAVLCARIRLRAVRTAFCRQRCFKTIGRF